MISDMHILYTGLIMYDTVELNIYKHIVITNVIESTRVNYTVIYINITKF